MIKSLAIWLLPTVLLVALYIMTDPVLALRWHEEMIPDGFLINKGNVTVKQFDHYNPSMKYDSFIVGSSLSINHLTEDWEKHLPEGSAPFHFDASQLTVNRMTDIVDYICENSEAKNMLIVLVPEVLEWTEDENLPFILPSELSHSLSDKFKYHKKNFFYWLDWRTFNGWVPKTLFDAEATGETIYKLRPDNPEQYYRLTNEERMMNKDSMLETESERFIYENPSYDNDAALGSLYIEPSRIDNKKETDFLKIKEVLEDKDVDYLVLMSPQRYYQILNPQDDAVLHKIFGDKYINLTIEEGKVALDPYNWYDFLHYRPKIGKKLMEKAYGESK